MKWLWITPTCPFPANSGEKIYTAGLLTKAAELGVGVSVLTLAEDDVRHELLHSGLRLLSVNAKRRSRLIGLAARLPSYSYALSPVKIKRELRTLLESEYAAVVIDHLSSAWALADVLAAIRLRKKHVPVVFISHNCDAQMRQRDARLIRSLPMRLVSLWEAKKYLRLEKKVVQAADLITTISDEDSRAFESIYGNHNFVTIRPGYKPVPQLSPPISQATPRRIVLVGSFNWRSKQENLRRFLDEGLKRFTEHRIEVFVVGQGGEVLAKEYKGSSQFLKFTGKVDSVTDYLHGSRIGVVPEELGGGFKLKVLDYVFNGIPVFCLENAAGGLPFVDGEEIVMASSMKDLVEKIIGRLDDDSFLNGIRRCAYDKAVRVFDWNESGIRLVNVTQACIGRRRIRMKG